MKNPLILQLPFYDENCDRASAENKLQLLVRGTFLLRPSSEPSREGKDCIVLSFVNARKQIQHDLINVDVSLAGRVVDLTLKEFTKNQHGEYQSIFHLINFYPISSFKLSPCLNRRFSNAMLIERAIENINQNMIDEYGYSGLLPKPPLTNKPRMLALQYSDVILINAKKVHIKIFMLSNLATVPLGKNPRDYADMLIFKITRQNFEDIAYLARKLESGVANRLPLVYAMQKNRSKDIPWQYHIPLNPEKLSELCTIFLRKQSRLLKTTVVARDSDDKPAAISSPHNHPSF